MVQLCLRREQYDSSKTSVYKLARCRKGRVNYITSSENNLSIAKEDFYQVNSTFSIYASVNVRQSSV